MNKVLEESLKRIRNLSYSERIALDIIEQSARLLAMFEMRPKYALFLAAEHCKENQSKLSGTDKAGIALLVTLMEFYLAEKEQ